jgi:hypothetical protein
MANMSDKGYHFAECDMLNAMATLCQEESEYGGATKMM